MLLRPKHLSKDNIMEGVREKDEDIFKEYFRINDKYTSEISPQDDPAVPDNNGDVEVQAFCSRSCGESNINNHSYVTLWSYADSKVMLPGDNESPSWNKLLEKKKFQDAIEDVDILLAPHHGRERGFHSDLFEYFKPRLTIVSDGRFGDTSATSRYSDVSKGWKVHRRNGKSKERYCITTRNDGVVNLKLGYQNNQKPYIYVKID